MFCRKCGKEIPDDSEYCPKCGAKMIAEALEERKIEQSKLEESGLLVCAVCGKPIPKGNMFCPSCGTDIPSVEIVSGNTAAPKKRSNKGTIIGIVAAAAVAVFAAIFIPIQVHNYKNSFPEFEKHLDSDGRYTIDKYVGDEEDVVIPDIIKGKPVYTINEYAFSGKKIKSVQIGKNTRIIGSGAFMDCLNLETVSFSNEDPQSMGNLVFFDQAFKNCSMLKSVEFPSTGIHIFSEAFYGCKKLSEIRLSDVLSIEDSAFENCSGLSYVQFENIEFTPRCFANCTALSKVSCNGCGNLIAKQAFSGCTNLTSFIVGEKTYSYPSELENAGIVVGAGAFYKCENFKDSETVTPARNKFSDYSAVELAQMTYEKFVSTFGNPEWSRFGSAYYDKAEVRISGNTMNENRGRLQSIVVFGGKEQVVINDVHLGESVDYYNARLSFNAYDALEIQYEVQGLGARYDLPVRYTVNNKIYKVIYRFNENTMIAYAAEVEVLS